MGNQRKIIKINEALCNGCGLCIPNCPEGALQIIDNKARLVSDLFCDGLGACIGHCPEGAITIEEREAEPYDEKKVMNNIVPQGVNTIKAHLKHLKDHGADDLYSQAVAYLKENNIPVPEDTPAATEVPGGGCPGSRAVDLKQAAPQPDVSQAGPRAVSQLQNWPVQLMLVPQSAPYLKNADLLIAADCVAFAYAEFHRDFIKDKVVIIACPKLDDAAYYTEKLTSLFQANEIKSVQVAHMQVPCCSGLVEIIKRARTESGKNIPISRVNISLQGDILEEVATV
ncbi:4Fe-4S binding protein [bacterium]|nr:4Fe-4S binding protein [bacterium]